MRIINGGQAVSITMEGDESLELRNITAFIMPEWLDLFRRKNQDYGNNAATLGIKGQFADIWRKIAKLKRAMWDDEQLAFEGTEEIIFDLIGHLFLSVNMMRVAEEAARVFAYNEDEAAVDAFFRMMDNDPSAALKASGLLSPPFGAMVAVKAKEMLEADQQERQAIRMRENSDRLLAEQALECDAAASMEDVARWRAQPLIEDAVEQLAARFATEAKGLIPAAARTARLSPGPAADPAAQERPSEAFYEAFDEPVVGEVGELGMLRSVAYSAEPIQSGELAEWLYNQYGRRENNNVPWAQVRAAVRIKWTREASNAELAGVRRF